MRKWDDPPSVPLAPVDDVEDTEKVRVRARAFRRWLARGAEPGGLRALADDAPHVPPHDAPDERPPA